MNSIRQGTSRPCDRSLGLQTALGGAGNRLRYRAMVATLTMMAIVVTTLAVAPATSAAAQTEAAPAIHFVIDVSGSMAGSRLTSATDAIKEAATTIPDTTALGLRAYAGSCDQSSVPPLVPIATDNDEAIIEAADNLSAGGGTPTTAALGEGINELAQFPSSGSKTLVLLTDGDTQCGITICDFVKANLPESIDLTINTVGLDVSSGAAQDLTCAAAHTGGQYIPVREPTDLASALVIATGARSCTVTGAGGWSFRAHLSADDGLVLDESSFKGRQFTQKVSAPYLVARYTEGKNETTAKAELTPVSSGKRSEPFESTLEEWECHSSTSDAEDIWVKAVYKVDNFMHPDLIPTRSGVRVTQMYRFRGEDEAHPCEPSDQLPCGRFWPTVSYNAGGLPTQCASAPRSKNPCRLFGGLTTVQRIEFRPEGTDAGAIDVYKDRDVGLGVETKGSKRKGAVGDSLKYETAGRAIVDGKRGRWDSIHQSPNDGTTGPDIVRFLPGCGECVHMHWAWGKQSNVAGVKGNPNPLDPRFTDGNPQILDGSTQDAVFGIVRLESGDEEGDPLDLPRGWRSLVDAEGSERAELRDHLPVVFWEMESTRPFDAAFPFLDDNYRHGGNGAIFFGAADHDH